MTIRVRTADQSDVDELLELWVALSADGHEADDRYLIKPDAAATARTFIARQWLVDCNYRVVVADAGTTIVGFMTARMAHPHHVLDAPPTAMITDAYVEPSHRRVGLGRQLFQAVRLWARDHDVEQLEVGTLALDTRAVGFWRSLGFGDWRIALARPTAP